MIPRASRAPAGIAAAVALGVALSMAILLLSGPDADARAPKRSKAKPKAAARQAPEIDLARWINTKPLSTAELSGTPRLVEFWTFDCVNCKNTVPAMRELHSRYGNRGLRVLGIHAPEFAHERDSAAVAAAVKREGIRFPVGLDTDRKVFDAFKNRHWPALFLIDRTGSIRVRHIGELHVGTRAWNNFCAAVESTLVVRAPVVGRRRRVS